MTQLASEQLKKAFHQDMIIVYKRILKELKYKSPRLMDLINKYGGYEAAIKYMTSENNVQDFAVLWENERLDLSVEALVTKPCYRELFLEDIVNHCDKKLSEYRYAPNKIEEEKEDEQEKDKWPLQDDPLEKTMTFLQSPEVQIVVEKQPYQLYNEGVAITKEMWQQILLNTQVVLPKNLDLLLRIYLIGDQVTPKELVDEEGYCTTYPYNEVVMALGKRIKAYLKVEVPVSKEGNYLWWHLLFVGGTKDNTAFEWSLRRHLREAIAELINQGELVIDAIRVKTNKDVIGQEEKELKILQENKLKNLQAEEAQDGTSDFDRLFEAIMKPKALEENKKVLDKNMLSTAIIEEQEEKEEKDRLFEELKKLEQKKVEVIPEEAPEETPQETISYVDKELAIKKECITYYGAICDICGFDYGYTYGEAYEQEIQVHNIKEDGENEILPHTDPIHDLIPICHNCHHIVHHSNPKITIERMRQIIKA